MFDWLHRVYINVEMKLVLVYISLSINWNEMYCASSLLYVLHVYGFLVIKTSSSNTFKLNQIKQNYSCKATVSQHTYLTMLQRVFIKIHKLYKHILHNVVYNQYAVYDHNAVYYQLGEHTNDVLTVL